LFNVIMRHFEWEVGPSTMPVGRMTAAASAGQRTVQLNAMKRRKAKIVIRALVLDVGSQIACLPQAEAASAISISPKFIHINVW
jgi:hypothetical protein